MTPERLCTVTEISRIGLIGRAAVAHAIAKGKLKASKINQKWLIRLSDFDEYKKSLYKRTFSPSTGELLFDKSKGNYSVSEVALLLKVPTQRIYYAIRHEQIKSSKVGKAWIIHESEIEKFKTSYLP